MNLLRGPILLLFPALVTTVASAQREEKGQQPIVYEAPHIAGALQPPRYPPAAAMEGLEGWVEFNFMVNTEGKAYEIYPTSHAGNDMFVASAKQALQETAFIPAKVGDKKVDGSMRMLYRFELDDVNAELGHRFVHLYGPFMSELEHTSSADAAVALQMLEEADVKNRYENAFLNIARYAYASKFGTPIEQMMHLRVALGESLARPDLESYLEDDAPAARFRLAQLQVLNSRFGEAMDTLELMHIRGDVESLELFREAAAQVVAFRNGDVAYPVQGRVNEDGSWFISLYRRNFDLTELTGSIEKLKLRCERDYALLDFDPTAKYTVPNAAGKCTLEVIGDAGATFTLMQR